MTRRRALPTEDGLVPAYDWRRDTLHCLLAIVFAVVAIGGLYGGMLLIVLVAAGVRLW